jgi:hypothetical protein
MAVTAATARIAPTRPGRRDAAKQRPDGEAEDAPEAGRRDGAGASGGVMVHMIGAIRPAQRDADPFRTHRRQGRE